MSKFYKLYLVHKLYPRFAQSLEVSLSLSLPITTQNTSSAACIVVCKTNDQSMPLNIVTIVYAINEIVFAWKAIVKNKSWLTPVLRACDFSGYMSIGDPGMAENLWIYVHWRLRYGGKPRRGMESALDLEA